MHVLLHGQFERCHILILKGVKEQKLKLIFAVYIASKRKSIILIMKLAMPLHDHNCYSNIINTLFMLLIYTGSSCCSVMYFYDVMLLL